MRCRGEANVLKLVPSNARLLRSPSQRAVEGGSKRSMRQRVEFMLMINLAAMFIGKQRSDGFGPALIQPNINLAALLLAFRIGPIENGRLVESEFLVFLGQLD